MSFELSQPTNFHTLYTAGPPITDPSMFFGRQADLERIVGLILTGNFVMLTGPRRIGKTSVLHQLAYHLLRLPDHPEKLIPVLANIEGTPETEFFHTLMEELVGAGKKHLPAEVISNLTFDLANPTYSARIFSRDLQLILKNLQSVKSKPIRLVLLLDEMDIFNHYDIITQSQLRRILQRFSNRNFSVVTAGVKLRQDWAGESSPFFNMFVPVTLTPFDEAEARRLITKPAEGIYDYTEAAITKIITTTLGLPHRIQQLCLETIYYLPKTPLTKAEITIEHVEAALDKIYWLDTEADPKDELNRMREFVSIISHELRTPLTVIRGYIAILQEEAGGPLTERQQEFLSTVSDTAQRMAELLNDILDISRLDTGSIYLDLQKIHIREVINEVVEAYQSRIENKGLMLNVNVADNLPEIWGDYGRIRQVILNLVSNAYKYTPTGGKISILADVYSDADLSGMAVTIQDTGFGISETDQSQLFTQFFRSSDHLTRSESGTGLGLAIAKNLTEAHGGKLTFESKLGQGSAFTVILPSKS